MRRRGPGKRGSNVVDVQLSADGSSSLEDIVEPLRQALASNLQRTLNLFREWDLDGNGCFDRREWRKALRLLGLDVDASASDALFHALDADGSGSIEYKELHKRVRKPVDLSKLTAWRPPAPAPPPPRVDHTHVARSAAEAAVDSLRRKLSADLRRTIDIFRDMDVDGSGAVDRDEFGAAVARLLPGCDAPTCAALFDALDADSSGYLEYDELHARLRVSIDAAGGGRGRARAGKAGVTTRMLHIQEAVPGRAVAVQELMRRDLSPPPQRLVVPHPAALSPQPPHGVYMDAAAQPLSARPPHASPSPTLSERGPGNLPPLPTLPRTLAARHRRVGKRMPLSIQPEADPIPKLEQVPTTYLTRRDDLRQPQVGTKWQWTQGEAHRGW